MTGFLPLACIICQCRNGQDKQCLQRFLAAQFVLLRRCYPIRRVPGAPRTPSDSILVAKPSGGFFYSGKIFLLSGTLCRFEKLNLLITLTPKITHKKSLLLLGE